MTDALIEMTTTKKAQKKRSLTDRVDFTTKKYQTY